MGHTACDHARECTYPEAKLASVNYPNQYFIKGSQCTWRIITHIGTFISLKFISFDVPAWDDCISSSLAIHDGITDNDMIIGKYCNTIPPPDTLQSGFNVAFLKFRSEADNPGDGFLIEYSTQEFRPNSIFNSSGESFTVSHLQDFYPVSAIKK